MSTTISTKLVKPVPPMRRVVIYTILLLAAFLVGFVPMWLKANDASQNLETTKRELSLAQGQLNLAAIQTALDTAVIEVQQGHYEPARQAASNFFTSLRVETERGAESDLSASQRVAVRPLLAQQDEIITLLARSSSTSTTRLIDLYESYVGILNK